MITIYPLKYIELQKYYNSLTFTLNELTLLLNVKGFYKGKQIDKNIAISKNHLYTSKTVLNNSLTLFYTYVLTDLNNFTYISSNITFNSIDPDKPEFLLYLDDDYNCVNNSITIISNTNISTTVAHSLTSFYSLSTDLSNLAYLSLTSLYSLTAEYVINIPKKISLYDIQHTNLYVDTDFPANPSLYDSFYNINTKRLYVYVSNSWQEIDWQSYIKSDKLYQDYQLRINPTTNALEYYGAFNWFEIIPTVGLTFTPVSYTGYIYYIAPGQTYIGYSSSNVPIMLYSGGKYKGSCYLNSSYYGFFGILAGGKIGGYASINYIYNDSYGINSNLISADYCFAPIAYVSTSTCYINFDLFETGAYNLEICSMANSNTSNLTSIVQTYYSARSTINTYFGVWCNETTPIVVDLAIIRREY